MLLLCDFGRSRLLLYSWTCLEVLGAFLACLDSIAFCELFSPFKPSGSLFPDRGDSSSSELDVFLGAFGFVPRFTAVGEPDGGVTCPFCRFLSLSNLLFAIVLLFCGVDSGHNLTPVQSSILPNTLHHPWSENDNAEWNETGLTPDKSCVLMH